MANRPEAGVLEQSTAVTGVQRGARSLAWLWSFGRRKPLGGVSLIVLVLVVLSSIFAAQISPYDPYEIDFTSIADPPGGPYILGTDYTGRDLLSRIIYGGRISLLVGFTSVGVGTLTGSLFGVASGYLGGKFDLFSQRFIEILLAFPGIILALIFLTAFGSGITPTIMAIAITRMPQATRVIRSVALSVREFDYVTAARNHWRIGRPHYAKACLTTVHSTRTHNRVCAFRHCDHHRSLARLPWCRDTGAHPDVGQHDRRSSGYIYPLSALVDSAFPRHTHIHRRDGIQSFWRRLARCARSSTTWDARVITRVTRQLLLPASLQQERYRTQAVASRSCYRNQGCISWSYTVNAKVRRPLGAP